MSVHRSVRVECDGCNRFGDEASTLTMARKKLNRNGWLSTKKGGDWCPECRRKAVQMGMGGTPPR